MASWIREEEDALQRVADRHVARYTSKSTGPLAMPERAWISQAFKKKMPDTRRGDRAIQTHFTQYYAIPGDKIRSPLTGNLMQPMGRTKDTTHRDAGNAASLARRKEIPGWEEAEAERRRLYNALDSTKVAKQDYADRPESKNKANKRKHDIRADPSTRDAVHAQDAATRQKIKDDPFCHADQLAAQSTCNLKVKERRKAEEKATREQEDASNTSMPAGPSNSKRRERSHHLGESSAHAGASRPTPPSTTRSEPTVWPASRLSPSQTPPFVPSPRMFATPTRRVPTRSLCPHPRRARTRRA